MFTYTSLDAPSRWSRVWRWLKYGGMIRGGATYVEASTPRPWAVPWRAWRALARHRRIIPSPLLYLVVAGIGLVVGVVVQLVLGVWWWLSPVVLLVVAWLVAFTSVWWRPRVRAGSVRAAVLSALIRSVGSMSGAVNNASGCWLLSCRCSSLSPGRATCDAPAGVVPPIGSRTSASASTMSPRPRRLSPLQPSRMRPGTRTVCGGGCWTSSAAAT